MQNLSKSQKIDLLVLNNRLQKLQEKIIKEAVKLDIELSKRVADKTDILDDCQTKCKNNCVNSKILIYTRISMLLEIPFQNKFSSFYYSHQLLLIELFGLINLYHY